MRKWFIRAITWRNNFRPARVDTVLEDEKSSRRDERFVLFGKDQRRRQKAWHGNRVRQRQRRGARAAEIKPGAGDFRFELYVRRSARADQSDEGKSCYCVDRHCG